MLVNMSINADNVDMIIRATIAEFLNKYPDMKQPHKDIIENVTDTIIELSHEDSFRGAVMNRAIKEAVGLTD